MVVKTAPNAFVGTDLGERVEAAGNKQVIVMGLMTHMCVTFTAEGAFLRGNQPTVVADATADMLCAKEETFGPFAPVFKFETEQEAVDAANNTEFGLASYFYSRDIGRIYRVAEALEYGMVGINVGILATEHVPFGGVKQSGLGREGSHHGMDDYVEIKYLCLGDIQK